MWEPASPLYVSDRVEDSPYNGGLQVACQACFRKVWFDPNAFAIAQHRALEEHKKAIVICKKCLTMSLEQIQNASNN